MPFPEIHKGGAVSPAGRAGTPRRDTLGGGRPAMRVQEGQCNASGVRAIRK